MNDKLDELLQNVDFLSKVMPLSPEEAQKEFAKEGVEITADELNEIAALLKISQSENGELDEAALDGVAGGRLISKRLIEVLKRTAFVIGPVRTPGW